MKIAEEEHLRRHAVIYARTVISPTLWLGRLTRALASFSDDTPEIALERTTCVT
jgi:hypothetical protein